MVSSRTLYSLLVITMLTISGCARPTDSYRPVAQYPNSKIWAHRVSDVASGREAEARFEGIEVDLN